MTVTCVSLCGSGVSRSSHRRSDVSVHMMRRNLVRWRPVVTTLVTWTFSTCCCHLSWSSPLFFSSSKILPTPASASSATLGGRTRGMARMTFTAKFCFVLLFTEISLLWSSCEVPYASDVLYIGIAATAIWSLLTVNVLLSWRASGTGLCRFHDSALLLQQCFKYLVFYSYWVGLFLQALGNKRFEGGCCYD